MMMIKKIFFPILFILGFNCFSQKGTLSVEIDSLLTLSDNYVNKDFEKSLWFAEKALGKAEEANDSRRKIESCYYIARSQVFFRNFEKSSKYIDLAFQSDIVMNDRLLQAKFLALQAGYYSRMTLLEESLQNYNKALTLVKSHNDLDSKLIVAYLYINISDYYTEVMNYELANKYADQSIAAVEKIPLKQYTSSKRIYKNKAFIYFYKSWLLLEQKKAAEAYPFIQKAYDQALNDKIDYMALFYEIYGDYYFQIKDFHTAIGFYLKAIDNKKKFKQFSANVDSKIALTYKMLGDSKNEIYYLKKAEDRRRLDLREYNKTFQKELNRELAKKQIKDDTHLKTYIITLIILLVFSLLLIIVIVKYQIIRKKKRRIIKEQMLKLTIKESEINEKIIEIGNLQQKVNNSFAELNDMVVNNDSNFWGRFQEVHPDFVIKMLEINSNLKTSEIIFCSYIYLGFTSKEIATYTFKAIRTIENNRYNLRKKLGLNSSEDFTVWMRKVY